MEAEDIKVNGAEFVVTTTPEQRLIKRNFERIFEIELTEEQLTVIEQVYQSKLKESKKDIAIYRGINFCLFLLLFVLALIFTGSWLFRIVLSFLTLYNFVHLWTTIKQYRRMI